MFSAPVVSDQTPPHGVQSRDDPYPIQSLLFCATCDQPFFGTRLSDGSRAYRSRCGCRREAFNAEDVERRVYVEGQRIAWGIALTPTMTCHCLANLAHRLFARVTLGATADKATFTFRIKGRE